MDIFLYVFAGCAVGLAVGITGVGGGSLMTPMLLLFGFPLHTAVGTDLAYAAITKSGGVMAHLRQRTVEWKIAGLMCLGSVPAALATIAAIHLLFDAPEEFDSLIRGALGVMLILTALSLFRRHWGISTATKDTAIPQGGSQRRTAAMTVLLGAVLGVLVTVSSVGAGAIAAAVVLTLYPRLNSIRVVGTDLAHAAPLTLVGAIGHFSLGNVDPLLLGALVAGSLPSIWLGTRIANGISDRVLQSVLATTLLGVGVKFTFF